jgi:hypothetical protein
LAFALEAPTETVEGYHDVHVGVRVYAQDDERFCIGVGRQEVHRYLLSLENRISVFPLTS